MSDLTVSVPIVKLGEGTQAFISTVDDGYVVSIDDGIDLVRLTFAEAHEFAEWVKAHVPPLSEAA